MTSLNPTNWRQTFRPCASEVTHGKADALFEGVLELKPTDWRQAFRPSASSEVSDILEMHRYRAGVDWNSGRERLGGVLLLGTILVHLMNSVQFVAKTDLLLIRQQSC